MDTSPTTPDTIVLIHGFWVTPRSWEHWIDPLREQGLHRARPGLSRVRGRGGGPERRPVADRGRSPCRRSSSHLEAVVGRTRQAADPDRPFRRRGVHPGPARPRLRRGRRRDQLGTHRGCPGHPLSQVRSTFPVLKNPANRHRAVGFTLEQWHYAFTNTFTEDESKALYERYHIPASGQHLLGHARSPTSTPATRTTGSTTTTTTARRCCSSPAARTT